MPAPYASRMKAHLAHYKSERLGVLTDGLRRSTRKPYAHILPEDLYRLNILEGIRKEFWNYFEAHKTTLALHTDFHHLNSSQAFAFNLLFPWLSSTATSSALLSTLGLERRALLTPTFEHMVNPAERTTLDLHGSLDDGSQLLVEVKLTEGAFGSVLPKDSHRIRLRDIYAPALRDMVTEGSFEEAEFFFNYQLYRNLSHLNVARGDVLVLIVPKANVGPWQQASDFMRTRLVASVRPAVRLIAAEELIASLTMAGSGLSLQLQAHMAGMREKYLLGV